MPRAVLHTCRRSSLTTETGSSSCAGTARRGWTGPRLRLLDCKEERCQPFIEGAPRSRDHLCAECEAHFADLVGFLEGMDVPFVLDHRLVRGLDYYTRTVFEVQTEAEGAQNALGGGGRYDGLIEEIGGKPTPGVGFAMGIERIILNLERQAVAAPEPQLPTVFVAYVGQKARERAVVLSAELVRAGVANVLGPASKSLKAQLRQAGGMGVQRTWRSSARMRRSGGW